MDAAGRRSDHSHVAVLEAFVLEESQGRAPATVRRYQRVLAHLLLFLDRADVAAALGTHAAALLEAERDFGREGAFFRLFGFEELVACLPDFLGPGWLAVSPAERRTQVSLVERLLGALCRRGLVDLQVARCAVHEARDAVRAARRGPSAPRSSRPPGTGAAR